MVRLLKPWLLKDIYLTTNIYLTCISDFVLIFEGFNKPNFNAHFRPYIKNVLYISQFITIDILHNHTECFRSYYPNVFVKQ